MERRARFRTGVFIALIVLIMAIFTFRLYALQTRVNLEYRFNERIGVFLTGGYGGSRYYNKGVTYDKGIIVEGGVVLLSFK